MRFKVQNKLKKIPKDKNEIIPLKIYYPNQVGKLTIKKFKEVIYLKDIQNPKILNLTKFKNYKWLDRIGNSFKFLLSVTANPNSPLNDTIKFHIIIIGIKN